MAADNGEVHTNTVILGLGSNQGDSMTILAGAVSQLSAVLDELRISSLYRTKPQDYLLQDDFFNMVAAGSYSGTPESLLAEIQHIETAYGRDRAHEIPKGPRPLDIDIIFFGTEVIGTASLTVPHPAYKQRCFVLIPLLEIFPEYTDPLTGVPLASIVAELPDQGVQNIGVLPYAQ